MAKSAKKSPKKCGACRVTFISNGTEEYCSHECYVDARESSRPYCPSCRSPHAVTLPPEGAAPGCIGKGGAVPEAKPLPQYVSVTWDICIVRKDATVVSLQVSGQPSEVRATAIKQLRRTLSDPFYRCRKTDVVFIGSEVREQLTAEDVMRESGYFRNATTYAKAISDCRRDILAGAR